GADRAAHLLQLLDDLLGGARRRAFLHDLGERLGAALEVLRVRGRAAANREKRGDLRVSLARDEPNLEPVRQLRLVDRRDHERLVGPERREVLRERLLLGRPRRCGENEEEKRAGGLRHLHVALLHFLSCSAFGGAGFRSTTVRFFTVRYAAA